MQDFYEPQVMNEIKRLYKEYGKSWARIAEELQAQGHCLGERRELAEKLRKYFRTKVSMRDEAGSPMPTVDEKSPGVIEQHADGRRTVSKLVRLRDAENMTPDEILKIVGFSKGKWQLCSFRFKAWNAYSKNEQDGGHDISELYSVSVTARPLKNAVDTEAIDKMASKWRCQTRFSDAIQSRVKQNERGENLYEINISDLHLGKLCWHGDTENNYDTKIVQKLFFDILDDAMSRVSVPVSAIVFVWANDFFNSDTIDRTTPAGTLQDTDIRWQKLFNIGCSMLIEAILRLVRRFCCPIKTFYIESNHDTMAGYYAIKVLESRFWNEPIVEVDASATPRKYVHWGNTLIMYTHGHNETNSALASCMVLEGRPYWSDIKYAEVHAAHLHTEKLIEEINGVLIRRLSAPTAVDSWHKRKGFISSLRKAQAFVIDKRTGVREVLNFPVDAYEEAI